MNGKIIKTILLVEDDSVTAKAGKTILEKFGYKVIHAGSGERACEIFSESGKDLIDLVLMDIDLGEGIDGTGAARRILKERIIPIVFLSSHTETEIVEKTEEITSYGYVVKNSGATVLDASIRMAFKLFESNEKMRAAEETYRNIFLNAQVGLYRTDIKTGIVIDANDCLAEFAGYKNRAELLADSFNLAEHYVRHEDREKMISILNEHGHYSSLEVEFVRIDGSRMWARYSGKMVPEKGWIEGVAEDITGRKLIEDGIRIKNEELLATNEEMEAANEELLAANDELILTADELQKTGAELRLKEDRFRSVVEQSLIGIAILDDKGRYSYVNEKFCSMAGYGETELLGRYYTFLLSDESKQVASDRYSLIKRGEDVPTHYEFSFIQKNGEKRIGELRNAVYPDISGRLNSLIQVIDITERKKIEEELNESRTMLLEMTAQVPGVVYQFYIRPDGKMGLHFLSRMAEKILGMEHSLDGFFERFTACVLPEYREGFIESIKKSGREFTEWKYEGVMKKPSGEKIWFSGNSFPARRGDEIIFNGIINDITERRQSEEKIKLLLAEKELILKEVHHRIKNNMNTINSILTLQADMLKDPSAISALEEAGGRVHSMMVLYDKLYQSLDFEEISVAKYIPPLVDEILANFTNSKSVRVVKKIDDFNLDVKRIQPLGIIINELITNIMKYAIPGGNEILITVSALLKSGNVLIEIRDTGIGIPESIDFKTTPGFGLQLVDMLTEQIGGNIRIERENGTAFILQFRL